MKILEVCAKLDIGGAQTVAANMSKYAEDDMHFTYLVFGDQVGELEQDIENGGHRVIHTQSPNEGQFTFFRKLLKLMKTEKYDVVHSHTMFNCGAVMLAAALAGVPARISHSHTVDDEAGNSFIRKLYRLVMRMLICCFGNEFFACGVEAGKVLYGARWFSKHGVVIKNGIDIASYQFSEDNRNTVRNDCGVSDKFVIGHVGHYVDVKNQRFLISILPEILRQKPNAELLMFGEGGDRATLEQLIKDSKLTSKARLMGNVRNVPQVLSAFDVFAFPSLVEGTPLALIEAQSNGVPCIISDRIPKDACLTDIVSCIPLEEKEKWINAVANAGRRDSESYANIMEDKYESVKTSMKQVYATFRKYERNTVK